MRSKFQQSKNFAREKSLTELNLKYSLVKIMHKTADCQKLDYYLKIKINIYNHNHQPLVSMKYENGLTLYYILMN